MNETGIAVEVDGLELRLRAFVPPAPVAVLLFLHGIPSVAPPDPEDRGYRGLAQDFARSGYLSAWGDMRGARDAPGYFSIEGWVRDANAFVEAVRPLHGGGLPLAVVGSSAGGVVAVEAAARGARVDALALLAAPARWVSFAGDPQAGVRRITDEAGMPLASEVLDDPIAWAAEFERVSTERSIARLDVPILLMHGTNDDVVSVEHAEALAAKAPRAELHIVEGAGHQLRRDDRAIRILSEWLRERFG